MGTMSHMLYGNPAAGEAIKDILTKNKPQTKAVRTKLNEPDVAPHKGDWKAPEAPEAPLQPSDVGESYKDLSAAGVEGETPPKQAAYEQGFNDKIASMRATPIVNVLSHRGLLHGLPCLPPALR